MLSEGAEVPCFITGMKMNDEHAYIFFVFCQNLNCEGIFGNILCVYDEIYCVCEHHLAKKKKTRYPVLDRKSIDH